MQQHEHKKNNQLACRHVDRDYGKYFRIYWEYRGDLISMCKVKPEKCKTVEIV